MLSTDNNTISNNTDNAHEVKRNDNNNNNNSKDFNNLPIPDVGDISKLKTEL